MHADRNSRINKLHNAILFRKYASMRMRLKKIANRRRCRQKKNIEKMTQPLTAYRQTPASRYTEKEGKKQRRVAETMAQKKRIFWECYRKSKGCRKITRKKCKRKTTRKNFKRGKSPHSEHMKTDSGNKLPRRAKKKSRKENGDTSRRY